MKHGMHNTKTYHAWENMKARCLNKKHPSFYDYGGRGIKVCEEWNDFEGFYKDMGECHKDLTLDRIDNDGSYNKGNCRWVNRICQQGNRRVSCYLTYRGEVRVLEQWAKEYGIGSGALHNRIFQLGWDIEKALITPLRKIKRKSEWRTRQAI